MTSVKPVKPTKAAAVMAAWLRFHEWWVVGGWGLAVRSGF
jgi:hypothetical protein